VDTAYQAYLDILMRQADESASDETRDLADEQVERIMRDPALMDKWASGERQADESVKERDP
jgi:hypothetical protein